MARVIDYPRASLKSAQELAAAVDSLGGRCSADMAAEKLNKKMSGAFTALLAATARYGLILSKKGMVEISPLYKKIKLAYTPAEASSSLAEAFLMPALFREIYERFKDRALPMSHFEKLLIRELGVPEAISSRIAKYFIDGAKQCDLLGPDHVLIGNKQESNVEEVESPLEDDENAEDLPDGQDDSLPMGAKNGAVSEFKEGDSDKYSITIRGPGMNSVIVINDVDDLDIVGVMLKKVRRIVDAEAGVWADE